VLFTVWRGRGLAPPPNLNNKEGVKNMDKEVKARPQDRTFYLRKLTKAGGSRYLSVGTILPQDWEAVKVYMEQLKDGVCILRLEQIK